MKKYVLRYFYLLLILLITLLAGCSSASLLGAIEKEGYSNVQILFQDDTDHVVIFLNEGDSGQQFLSLNTYSMENSWYRYNGNGVFSQMVDISNKHENIRVNTVGNSSIVAIWGGVFNYPNATTVSYILKDKEGNEIYNSEVNIENNTVYEKLPASIYEQMESYYYKIIDGKNNVIYSSEFGTCPCPN